MDGIGTLDWILLAIVAVSVVVGLWRGLVFEVLSLLGWVVAYVAAQLLAGTVAEQLPVGAPGSGVNHAAAFALTFIVVLIAWAIAARLVRWLVGASLDRSIRFWDPAGRLKMTYIADKDQLIAIGADGNYRCPNPDESGWWAQVSR